jgi:hypothetical protein
MAMASSKFIAGMVTAYSGLIVGLATFAVHPFLDVLILLGSMALLLYSAVGLFQLSESRDWDCTKQKK